MRIAIKNNLLIAIRTIRSELLKIILEKNLTKLPGAGMLFFGVFHAFLPAIDKKRCQSKDGIFYLLLSGRQLIKVSK